MSVLYVEEYARIGGDNNGPYQMGAEPSLASQTVAESGSSAKSSAFQVATTVVRIHTDAICSINFGPAGSVTAATTNKRMAANQTEYFVVPRGGTYAVAVITNT